MKKIIIISIILLLIVVPVTIKYAGTKTVWLPILMTRTQLENSITATNVRLLQKPGKIYAKDQLFYIVEAYKGIHIINNSDPANPQIEGFITVPGCVDLAIKGSVMYVDNATDLVAIDISSLPEIAVVKRIENIFPELVHPEWGYVPDEFSVENRPENTVIVGWQKE
jgi:hypothetical protein